MSTAAEIEAAMFKRMGDHYAFQAPSEWVVGPKRRYLVTEAQKQELLAIATPQHPALRIAIVTLAVLVWAIAVSGLLWMLSAHDDPTILDLLAMAALIMLPLFLGWMVMVRRNLRRMQPILAQAPRTEERITSREQRAAMAGALSLRRAVIYGSLWTCVLAFQALILVLRNNRLPLLDDVQSYLSIFTAVIAAGLAVYYFGIAVRRVAGNAKPAP